MDSKVIVSLSSSDIKLTQKQTALNQKGQGLVEYLIIVALVAVAGIAVMKVLGQNIRVQYARIAKSIQGVEATGIEADSVEESHYKSKDLSNFFNGAASSDRRSR